jgi:hypothetical protein
MSINQAKAYARKRGKSISQIVSDDFTVISNTQSKIRTKRRGLGPIASQLCRTLKGATLSEND